MGNTSYETVEDATKNVKRWTKGKPDLKVQLPFQKAVKIHNIRKRVTE